MGIVQLVSLTGLKGQQAAWGVPAGYSLKATTPAFCAASTSDGGVLSVKYSVISGVKGEPAGRHAWILSL